VIRSPQFFVKTNPLVEHIIYFSTLFITFGLIYYIRLQIVHYERNVYNTEENLKLQELTNTHKQQISVLIKNIQEEMSPEFMDDLQQRDLKSYEVFQRSFQRIENTLQEIHKLGTRSELNSVDKVYDLWPTEK